MKASGRREGEGPGDGRGGAAVREEDAATREGKEMVRYIKHRVRLGLSTRQHI